MAALVNTRDTILRVASPRYTNYGVDSQIKLINTTLANIASDTLITEAERQSLRKEWDQIIAEYVNNSNQGLAYLGTLYPAVLSPTNYYAAYTTAVQTLATYLNAGSAYTLPSLGSSPTDAPNWISNANLSSSTPVTIVSATFRANWKDVYDKKTALVNKATEEAGKVAGWSGITGTGKPADNATVGAPAGTLINGVAVETVTTAVTNFNTSNDRNSTAVTAPTILSDGTAVDHTLQANGSADISFEWQWSGNEGDIDGYRVFVYSSSSSSAYTFGTTPAAETVYEIPAVKRAFILFGTIANYYYTFGVQAYRKVDKDINAAGVIVSSVVKPSLAAENPYQPSASVAFSGNVTGTVNGIAATNVNVWASISGSGRPADNATKNTVTYATTAPGSPTVGDIWVDNTTASAYKINMYYSGSWQTGATVGAPTGTKVGGTNAETVESNASTALSTANTAATNANTANSDLAKIASDAWLTDDEKPQVKLDYDVIIAEQSGIDARATAYSITTEKTTYDTAVSALTTYLGTLTGWNTIGSGPVAITGTTFRTKFQDVYAARQVLLNKIAEIAGTVAAWTGVTGSGKPADNATKNIVTYSSSAPGSPVDGDIWIDTTVSPYVVKVRYSNAWQLGANLTTNTSQLTDGANLGGTAQWTGMSGVIPGSINNLMLVYGRDNCAQLTTGGSIVADSNGSNGYVAKIELGWNLNTSLGTVDTWPGTTKEVKGLIQGKTYRLYIRAKKVGTLTGGCGFGIYNSSTASTVFSSELQGRGLTTSWATLYLGSFTPSWLSTHQVYTYFGQSPMGDASNYVLIDWLYFQAVNVDEGATVGAPSGTYVGGVLADNIALGTNLVNPNQWTYGTYINPGSSLGSWTGTGIAGVTNSIDMVQTPDGSYRLGWIAYSGTSTDSGGGFENYQITINPSKTYRFSVWVRRISSSSGNFYFGPSAYGSGALKDTSTNAESVGNYTFSCIRSSLVDTRWYLFVGYVFPYMYASGASSHSGIYDGTTGGKVGTGIDFYWANSSINTACLKAFQYYCNGSDNRSDFWGPRVDLCDGTEPDLAQLLSTGTVSGRNKVTSSNTTNYLSPGAVTARNNSEYTGSSINIGTSGSQVTAGETGILTVNTLTTTGQFTKFWGSLYVNGIINNTSIITIIVTPYVYVDGASYSMHTTYARVHPITGGIFYSVVVPFAWGEVLSAGSHNFQLRTYIEWKDGSNSNVTSYGNVTARTYSLVEETKA